MNGTIYDEIKKNGDSKKKEKLKFIVAIISTNLLVAILCLSFKEEASSPAQTPISKYTTHPHYKMVVTPLTLLVDKNTGSAEIPVTLMNKSKKILIQRAYLHEEVALPNKELGGQMARFKIEIPEEEVLKLSADSEEPMIAIPELKIPTIEKKLSTKRVSQYEVGL